MINYHSVGNRPWRLSVSVRGKAKRVRRLGIEAIGIYEVLANPSAAIPDQGPKFPVTWSDVSTESEDRCLIYGILTMWPVARRH